MSTKTLPSKGDTFVFERMEGYVLYQNRPFRHREGCESCEKRPWASRCDEGQNGRAIVEEGTVTEVIHWADNSIEVVGVLADGSVRRQIVVTPHGDVCF